MPAVFAVMMTGLDPVPPIHPKEVQLMKNKPRRSARTSSPEETEQTWSIAEIESMYRSEQPARPEREIRMATLVAYTDQLMHLNDTYNAERRLEDHVTAVGLYVDQPDDVL